MTDVKVKVTRNHYHVKVMGHADDPTVCAGVSALTQMLAGCLMNHDDVKVKTFTIEEGHVELDYTSPGWKVLEDTKAMIIGLLQIELGYPKHIKIDQNVL